jgi:Tfp pilus assembly major pilin PilA
MEAFIEAKKVEHAAKRKLAKEKAAMMKALEGKLEDDAASTTATTTAAAGQHETKVKVMDLPETSTTKPKYYEEKGKKEEL